MLYGKLVEIFVIQDRAAVQRIDDFIFQAGEKQPNVSYATPSEPDASDQGEKRWDSESDEVPVNRPRLLLTT